MPVRHYQFSMGITHADLHRVLPVLFPDQSLRWGEGTCSVVDGNRGVAIRYAPEQERRLAALAVPRTEVVIELDGYSDAEAAAFLALFERCFRKGGG